MDRANILGVPVTVSNLAETAAILENWATDAETRYVCVRDTFGLMLSVKSTEMLEIQHGASMVTADGIPLVWAARALGHSAAQRVCGADLLEEVCARASASGTGHFFYGGREGVVEELCSQLVQRHPGLRVVGMYTPPFRPLTAEEDRAVIEAVQRSGAKYLWVGISTPKQEYFMWDHRNSIPGVTMLGIGAAFDFQSGQVKRAPQWMRNGLEWLHRLVSEPRRLWRRYILIVPQFAVLVLTQVFITRVLRKAETTTNHSRPQR